jgi:hypothetical protein
MTEIQNDRGSDPAMTLPAPGVSVVVQCDHLRCLAYRSGDGKWLATFTGQEITNVHRFFPLTEFSKNSPPSPNANGRT